MRIAFDGEEFFHFDRTVFADAAKVIAAEVHEHDVFGALFFAREHLALKALVFGFVFAAAARAGDGTIENVPSLNFDKHFRRTADDCNIVQLKIKKIRRRIQRAQLAIDFKWIGLRFHRKALAEYDLENVASADVLLGFANDLEVFGAVEIRIYFQWGAL